MESSKACTQIDVSPLVLPPTPMIGILADGPGGVGLAGACGFTKATAVGGGGIVSIGVGVRVGVGGNGVTVGGIGVAEGDRVAVGGIDVAEGVSEGVTVGGGVWVGGSVAVSDGTSVAVNVGEAVGGADVGSAEALTRTLGVFVGIGSVASCAARAVGPIPVWVIDGRIVGRSVGRGVGEATGLSVGTAVGFWAATMGVAVTYTTRGGAAPGKFCVWGVGDGAFSVIAMIVTGGRVAAVLGVAVARANGVGVAVAVGALGSKVGVAVTTT